MAVIDLSIKLRRTSFEPIKAGDALGGYIAGSDVANTDSISASLEPGYIVEPGFQKIPLAQFYGGKKPSRAYSVSEQHRTDTLALKIIESGRMDPLIIVIDNEGPYVLEGGHRLDAAYQIPGATHVPAMVVREYQPASQAL
jgi:hypothetical protein